MRRLDQERVDVFEQSVCRNLVVCKRHWCRGGNALTFAGDLNVSRVRVVVAEQDRDAGHAFGTVNPASPAFGRLDRDHRGYAGVHEIGVFDLTPRILDRDRNGSLIGFRCGANRQASGSRRASRWLRCGDMALSDTGRASASRHPRPKLPKKLTQAAWRMVADPRPDRRLKIDGSRGDTRRQAQGELRTYTMVPRTGIDFAA